LTPLARKLAFKVGALDIPKDARKIHNKPMPYFGGIAIYVAIMACMFLYMPQDKTNVSIMIGATIIVLTGIVDDMYGMPAKIKLIMQIVAAAVAISGGVKIHFITNPLSTTGMSLLRNLTIPITLFWIVGITNTINLIDGLDGLASGVASIAATTLLFTAALKGYDFIVMQCAIIAGACLGFLPFNFNPAKIFMGETGSAFIGFMLAALSIRGVMKGFTAVSVVLPIIILGLPIMDTAFAIFRRFINRRPISQADRGHLHHRLLDRGFSQKQAVLILYVVCISLGVVALLISGMDREKGIATIGLMTVFILLFASQVDILDIRKSKGIKDSSNRN